MDDDNVLNAELEFRIKHLEAENSKLKHEIIKCKVLLNEIDSDANPNLVTDEEAICVEQIRKLKTASSERELSADEVKKLDILHRNLKLARGEETRINSKGKVKKLSSADLTDLVKGN